MSLLIYALCWLAFAVIHSILARQFIQLKLEVFLGCYYRLTYNLLAAIKIIAVLYIGRILLSDTRFHLLESTAAVVATVSVQLVGIMVLAVALAAYDIGRFSGITQIVNKERVSTSFNEPLQRRLLNKWVRHPSTQGLYWFYGEVQYPASVSVQPCRARCICGSAHLLKNANYAISTQMSTAATNRKYQDISRH